MKKDRKRINTSLLLLLFGRMVSDTGTGIQMVIMPLYIIDAGGSAATVGLFSFLSLMPTLLVYPFAGVWGDRLNRKMIMVATDIASAIVILGLAFASYGDRMNLILLLAVQVVVALLYGFFDPATKGMLPRLVSEEELTRANAILASLRTLSGVLSPVIGAALYTGLGVAAVFLINGISFLISGSCSVLIRYQHTRREFKLQEKGFWTDLAEGARFILGNRAIRRFCTFFLVIYALIQPVFTVVLPLFFRSRLHYTDTWYGYLQMAILLGALLGSVLVGVVFAKEKKATTSLFIGCFLQIVTTTAFAILLFPRSLSLFGNDTVLYFVLLAAVLSFLGAALMFVNVPVQTFVQKATPNEYMSRVFSIVGMISKGGMPFGALIYGFALNKIEVHWTVLAADLLMVFISVVFLAPLLKTRDNTARQ
ncbi:putative multidrug-efflux transporter [Pelotomaculum sp. FP]|nr:putative multidrug-efflux transporter [Pelotomaculum sp. FP]